MIINDKTALERAWAIPAISALMILHHDFSPARLAQIRCLVWAEASLDVALQYGSCNLSGTILDANDLLVTLHRDGAVGVRIQKDQPSEKQLAMVQFLAGEISRETIRWREDLAAWSHDDTALPQARAAIFNIVGALIACPDTAVAVVVEKALTDRSEVIKVRIHGAAEDIDISPAGTRGANLYIRSHATQARAVRAYRKYDLPAAARVLQPKHRRLLDKVSFTTVQLALLPMEFILYLCEQGWSRQMDEPLAVSARAAQVIDASAGDSLSALFS